MWISVSIEPDENGILKCPKSSGETVSFSTATAAFSLAKGGIFLRRALIAAAFSSESGGCCGFLSASERYSVRAQVLFEAIISVVENCLDYVILPQKTMFSVQKRLFCLLSCNKSTIHLSSYQLCSLFSFSTAEDHSSNHRSKFMLVEPLQSCELSSKEAAKMAKDRICERKLPSSSPSIEFFKQSGWSDAQVMKLIKRSPYLLHANLETALKPRMRSLQDMGFSDTEIVQLVSSWPNALLLRDIKPRINFWRSILGSNERLLKACKRNMFIFNFSLARTIEPNISLFRERGISDERIAHMVMTMPGCFGGIDKLKEVIKYIEELGVPCDSGLYTYALNVVMGMNRSRFDATSATLMSFGWSQPDIIALFRKSPSIWTLSSKNICDKMTFLMKEAGCELTFISSHPILLKFSLEKRLRPRYEVLKFLDQNKLLDREHNLVSVVMPTEEMFRKKFLSLLRNEKFIAQYDSYVAVQGKHHVVAEN
ncbi:hypothetical protein C4D60_Mb10t27900 [Musa balbisiana]|uniref:Uncharacterized protein n=1 Tax=Musa balbisiana TaxID=52838 RepID=A0A4S8J159_MUSBA|nr:hypothetical protein C4D60_Mb10t27900 [Musa balbisiana]